MAIDTTLVQWSAPENERSGRPLLVALHGFNGNETTLQSIAADLPSDLVIASPRGPREAPNGFAWIDLSQQDPAVRNDQLNEASEALIEWLDEIDGDFTSVGVLGFSMGGALSVQLLRHRPERFAYAVSLAGFVVTVDNPGDEALAAAKPPVFWGTGADDKMASPEFLANVGGWLEQHTTLEHHHYEGVGHAISPEMLKDVAAFISANS